MTPEQCISAIRRLPDSRLEAHGIRGSYSYQHDDSLILGAAREEYLAKSQWLEFSWLNHVNLSNELTSTWKISYKPHSERTSSFKRLAEEIYQRDFWMQAQRITPLDLTLGCEIQICEGELINSGYIADRAVITGKRENYINASKCYDRLEATDKIRFGGSGFLLPKEALEASGAYLASLDTEFKNTYWRDYLLQQKRFHRLLAKGSLSVFRIGVSGSVEMVSRGNSLGSTRRGDRVL